MDKRPPPPPPFDPRELIYPMPTLEFFMVLAGLIGAGVLVLML